MATTSNSEAPYLFPKSLLSLFVAAYAWQTYGFWRGFAVYIALYILLAVLGWTSLVRGWSFRQLVAARVTLIILSMVALGLSAMETCSADMSECRRVFWPN